jgi:hypothetical protein
MMWGSDYSQTRDGPLEELVSLARRSAAKLNVDAPTWFLADSVLHLWPG